MQPVESPAGVAEETEVAERFPVSPVDDPHDVVHDVGDIDERLFRTRECHAACRAAIQCLGRHSEFPHEHAIFGEYLYSIRAAISSINETVICDRELRCATKSLGGVTPG